ncbi:uncharacterized protein LOC130678662 [Microplitis mediator]|uniref:uncharacterized protein LOC130678662 n=1 Tax=Microplitis mediator TaxID=375433 RepID=UPI002552FF7F|nr:uncharacterized protein LOC130678662 [Microplitis mediator]
MSDLIDLTSPEDKKIRGPKLTSPLIPLPSDKDEKSCESKVIRNPIINLEACGNLDDNPFDSELRKTNEFVSKSQDPFEVVWEKSMKTSGESRSLCKSTGDQSGKSKRHADALKMNKTSDGLFVTPSVSLTHKNFSKSKHPLVTISKSSPDYHELSILDQSFLNDSFLLDCSVTGRPSTDRHLKRLAGDVGVSSPKVNLSQSILNQSTLNDSLSGSSGDDTAIKSIVAQRLASCVQQGIREAEEAALKTGNENYHKLRRSLSQGCQLSPHYLSTKAPRSQSTAGARMNTSLLSSKSSLLEDPLNNGFLQSSYNTISDLSSIRKLSSASGITGSSSAYTNNTINCAFINSASVSDTEQMKRSINSRLSSSFAEISDLKAKLNLLKAKSSLGSLEKAGSSLTTDPENFVIDHNITSDSVFTDEELKKRDDDKSLATLERMLAKSQESSGSIELPSRIPSDTEVLTDSEVRVENLIELSSDTSNSTGLNSADKLQSQSSSQLLAKSNDANSTVDLVRELEKELIAAENKPSAATLLMDLKKLIKAENNYQVTELLKNLEEMLGVKSQSNVDLLEICMATSTSSSASKDNEIKINDPGNSDTSSINSNSKSPQDLKNSKSPNDSIHKLIAGIQTSLEKLLSESVGEPKILLEKLNKVFSSVVSDDNEAKSKLTSPVKTARVYPMNNPGLSRSVSSITRRSVDSPSKKYGGLKRVTSTTQIPEGSSPRRSSSAGRKVRVDSPKKEIKSRLSSSFGHRAAGSRADQLPKDDAAPVKIKPVPVLSKTKLRSKKPESETTKGPLKAVIPLGNMHRRASLGKRVAPLITPATPPRARASIGKTSTPNSEEPGLNCLQKPPKTKPLAASTPEGGNKNTRSSLPIAKSPKPSWNISPVTPNAPRTATSPRVTPRTSPRPQFNKNNSYERPQVKMAVSSPRTPKASPRVTDTSKDSQKLRASLSSKHSINKLSTRRSEPIRGDLSRSEGSKKLIPGALKESNSPVAKVKPVNLATKFVLRRSGSFKLPEKENKF